MTQKTIDVFLNEIYSKHPEKSKAQTKLMYTILTTFGL